MSSEIRPEDIAAMPRAKRASPALRLARDTVDNMAVFLAGNERRQDDPFQMARDFLVEYFRGRFERCRVRTGDMKRLEPQYNVVAQRGAQTYRIGAMKSSAMAFRYTDVQMEHKKELLAQGETASPTVTLVNPDILDSSSSRLSVVQLPSVQQDVVQRVISCTDGFLLDKGVKGNVAALDKGHGLYVHGSDRLRTITSADSRDLEAIQGGEVATDIRARIQQVVPGLFITEFHSALGGLNVTEADGLRL